MQAGPVLVQAQKKQVSFANNGLLQKMSKGKFFFLFSLMVWMTPLLMAQTITTGTIASPICAGATISIPYTITGVFTSPNRFVAQLSNSAGAFTTPVLLDSVLTTTAGTITAQIPFGTAAGTGYKIRVIGRYPAITGTANATALTINANTYFSESSNPFQLGNALNFDGDNDKVTITDNTVGNFGTGAFTVEFWINTTKGNSNLISKRTNCYPGTFWNIKLNGSNVYAEFMTDNTGSGNFGVSSSVSVTDGKWHHVSVTRNTAGLVTIFVDGANTGSGTNGLATPTNVGTLSSNTANVTLGSSICGFFDTPSTANFKGSIDEVRLWGTERTLTQINASRFLGSLGTDTVGLKAYYDFNQGTAEGSNGSASTATDKSGKLKNATLLGFDLIGKTSNWINSGIGGTICIGSKAAYSNTQAGGVWSVTNGTGTATVTTAGVVTGVTAGTVTVNYTRSTGTCSVVSRSILNISSNTAPSAPTAGVTQSTVCPGGSTLVNATFTSASNVYMYIWTTPNPGTGTVTCGTTVSGIFSCGTGAINATTTFYLGTKNIATGCESATRFPVTATVYSTPAITIASSALINNQVATLAGGTFFNSPTGVAVDAAGNVYVAEPASHYIRKITPAGVVSTLAGSGTAGSSDGTGSAASFYNPTGVAVDAAGNVYVADQYNNKIRKITPAGVVSTLAGSVTGIAGSANGTGSAASFNNPTGVAVDAAGNVYVADQNNHKICKITPAGVVSTLAGSGTGGSSEGTGSAASFYYPSGVAVDAAGNVYVADYFNNKIRKITPAGVVSTLAGSTAGSADGSGSLASFFYPYGVAVDAAGNVYVADYFNNKIRKITPAGLVSTFAGTDVQGSSDGGPTTASFYGITGVAVDAAGNVYAADQGNNKIRKIFKQVNVCSGSALTFTAGGGVSYSWSGPQAISNGTSFNASASGLYIVTATNATGCTATQDIYVNLNNPPISTITGTLCPGSTLTATPTTGIQTLAWALNGNVATTTTATWNATGTTVAGGNGLGAEANQLQNTYGVYVDGSGNVYVVDKYNDRIQRWAPGATSGITVAGGNGFGSAANQLSNPNGVFVDGSGNVYVADGSNHRIQRWAPGATSGITVAGGNGAGSAANQLNGPTGVYVDASGNVYVSDANNNRIQRWAPGATSGTTVAGGNGLGSAANQLNVPRGVSVDGSGNVYVADEYNHRIQRWAPGATSGTTVAGGNGAGNAANQLSYPCGVFVDGIGNVYVAEEGNSRIKRLAPGAINGTTIVTVGNGFVSGVFVDGSGNVYVADYYNERIQRFAPAGIVNSLSNAASGTYTVTATNFAGCSSISAGVVLNPLPAAPTVTTPSAICGSGSAVINAATAAGTTVDWYSASTGGTLLASGSLTYTTPVLTATRIYYAQARNTTIGCVSATRNAVTVTVNPLPTAPTVTTPSAFCGSGSAIINATAAAGTTVDWYSASTGGTLLASGSLTYTTPVLTATTIYYAQTRNICVSATRTAVTVTVNPLPAAPTITPPPAICISGSTLINATTDAGNTVDWYSGTVVNPLASGTLSFTTPVITAATNYYAQTRNTTTGCVSATRTAVTATVNTIPAAPVISGSAQVCKSSAGIVYSVGAVTGEATSYTWTLPTGMSGTSTTNSITVATSSTFAGGNVQVVANNSCGSSAVAQFAVTAITTLPAAPASITGSASVCAGGSQTYVCADVTGCTYTWTAPANATITSGQGSNTATFLFDAAYTTGSISVKSVNCFGTSTTARTLTAAKKAIPGTVGVITGITAGVCSTENRTYSIVALANTDSYEWTAPTGATISSGQGSTSVVVQFAAGFTTGSLSVKGVNCSGISATARTLALSNVTAAPTVLTGPATAVCAGSTQTYSTTAVAGASTYTWAVPTGAIINSGQGSTSISVTFPSPFTSGAVTVNSGTACYTSAAKSLTVYSAPVAPASITGTAVGVCAGTTQTYTCPASTTGATTYTWTAPTGATINSGQCSTSVSVTFPAGFVSGSMSVTAGNACGTSTARTLAVSAATAQPGVITGTASNLCTGGSFTYSIVAVTGATTYSWTAPAGCTITANTGTSITMTVPAGFTTGTLSVIANNACGASTARTLALIGVPPTPASITGPVSVCASATGLVYSTPVVAGVTTYTWTVPTGAVITAGAGTSSITVTWGTVAGNVTVKAGNACGTNATARSLAVARTAGCREAVEEVVETMSLYPNPASQMATLNFSSAKEGDYQIRVINALGQSVYSSEGKASEGTNAVEMNLEKLSSGLYIVQLVQDGSKQQVNLIKK